MDFPFAVVFDRASIVNGFAEHIHDAAQRTLANRHGDGCTRIVHFQTAFQAVT